MSKIKQNGTSWLPKHITHKGYDPYNTLDALREVHERMWKLREIDANRWLREAA